MFPSYCYYIIYYIYDYYTIHVHALINLPRVLLTIAVDN